MVSGTYWLEAHWAGHPGTPSRVVSVPPSQSGVDLVFPTYSEVTGTVRDHEGVPLEGIEVRAAGVVTLTNAAGNYLLRLEAGNYCVSVHSGQRPVCPPPQTVRVPPGRSAVDFAYPRDYEVSGAVLDFDATPLTMANRPTRQNWWMLPGE